ncbi:hypothetical protein sS8_0191 [Methylocaldum marinum]|uniref:Uncharacterized protein n=1 Tax=Methylocaldum marinum TaxID=1432792 RepID=A0A286P3D7_9GAMM|nr:hypothetical protein sS8_0191 [Methylocaldum marinum]
MARTRPFAPEPRTACRPDIFRIAGTLEDGGEFRRLILSGKPGRMSREGQNPKAPAGFDGTPTAGRIAPEGVFTRLGGFSRPDRLPP